MSLIMILRVVTVIMIIKYNKDLRTFYLEVKASVGPF